MKLYHSPCKQHVWIEAPADQREAIIASGRAEFVTALDLDNSADDPNQWTYQGPFYVDFDSEDIGETTGQFQKFLRNLQALGLDLDQVSLYASGKKGYHIEIPQGCFMTAPKPLERLPAIYKEVAFSLYHDTLDLAVYTAKMGRMWRVPNFKRPDTGTYKVQITLEEAMAMTPATYAELVSKPRPRFATAEPTLCPNLAKIFVQGRDKVQAASKSTRRAVPDRTAGALRQRLEQLQYPFPACLLPLVSGTAPAREGLGFNMICIQLATVARALQIGESDFIETCRGLINNHAGDGTRYATRDRREAELRKQFKGCTYSFSIGGIRSILPPGTPCNDLRGL